MSVPRSPGSGPAFLPRRPCQPACLWEHLVPELTGTNKEALFLTVWSAFVGLGDGGVYPQEVVRREGEMGPAGQCGH